MTKEESNSFSVTPNSGRKKGFKSNNHKNRIEFRVPSDELWVYESVAKLLFENGHIPNQTVSEAARFSFRLYARDYVTRGDLLTTKLRTVVPIAYYDQLVTERDSEKQLRLLYEQANEALASLLGSQSQTIDNCNARLKPGAEESHVYEIPDASQASTAKAQANDKALKGRFIYFPALITGRAAHDYKASFKNDQL